MSNCALFFPLYFIIIVHALFIRFEMEFKSHQES